MTVSYDKEQRQYAKEHGLRLCTIGVDRSNFQGPCTAAEVKYVDDCLDQFLRFKHYQEKNPFICLEVLTPDVDDALEQFKLCIIRHRASQFSDLSRDAFLEVIAALKAFVLSDMRNK